MRATYNSIALCAQALSAAAAVITLPADGLTVQTNTGLVSGFYNSSAPNVRQFLGIPYAQPPVGDLRFAPPLPATQRSGTLNATKFAPSCMQKFSSSQTIYTQVVPEFLINGGQSEDCLYLNVWAPNVTASAKELLPVLLYIPGGGFTSGGADSVYKYPDQWIQRTQSHLVVVMKYFVRSVIYRDDADRISSYRVNVFGFPNAAGLTDLNVGLLDQRTAYVYPLTSRLRTES